MRRFILAGLLALGFLAFAEVSAHAFGGMPPGVGGSGRRIGRIQGFWLNPSTGRLKDYSSYFAHKYPWLPGAAEYQYNPYGNYYQGGPMPAGTRIVPSTPAKSMESPEPPTKK